MINSASGPDPERKADRTEKAQCSPPPSGRSGTVPELNPASSALRFLSTQFAASPRPANCHNRMLTRSNDFSYCRVEEFGILPLGPGCPHTSTSLVVFRLFSLFSGCYGWLFLAVIVPPRLPEGEHFRDCAGLLAIDSLHLTAVSAGNVQRLHIISRIGRIRLQGCWRG
jgi:hypothetical protein